MTQCVHIPLNFVRCVISIFRQRFFIHRFEWWLISVIGLFLPKISVNISRGKRKVENQNLPKRLFLHFFLCNVGRSIHWLEYWSKQFLLKLSGFWFSSWFKEIKTLFCGDSKLFSISNNVGFCRNQTVTAPPPCVYSPVKANSYFA